MSNTKPINVGAINESDDTSAQPASEPKPGPKQVRRLHQRSIKNIPRARITAPVTRSGGGRT
jgi:hypothetical protein